eukprot:s4837_g2.t1
MCGLMEPSRAHLTWACSQTSAYRTAAALDIPADRASERLFAPPLEAYPPAPATCHDEGHWFCACLGTSYGFGWCWFILLSVCGLLCVVRVLFLFLRGLLRDFAPAALSLLPGRFLFSHFLNSDRVLLAGVLPLPCPGPPPGTVHLVSKFVKAVLSSNMMEGAAMATEDLGRVLFLASAGETDTTKAWEGGELGQVVFVDGGSWETPGKFQYPNKWKSQGLWTWIRRRIPEHYDALFDLVQEHYCSIHLLLEALLTKISEILSKDEYEQLIRNAIEQGALTETPLGATGFAMPTTRMSSNHLPDEWKVVDMNIPCHPNWCTGVGVTRASQSNQ